MDITYNGEWAWAGTLGNFLVVLAFGSAVFAFISYLFSTQKDALPSWKKLGRLGFRVHSLSILGVIAILFILLFNHRYEFQYVWKHLNNEMSMKYVLSCFWEGQEGGFLLWMFWNLVLGNLLIWKAGKWEKYVMAIYALVQLCLATMILGVYFGDYQFGINPFLLLREASDNIGLPWTMNPDYLTAYTQFQDGRGLNPLLQNYWMTIHPPTLFLGFASTLVPFAYAAAGLWRKDWTGWMKPAIPWAFFAVMILGTGILMGGAWAYEALSFGGFWAWDPVENSSLVPWIIMVGGAHLLLVNKRKTTSLFTTFLLVLGSFVLVVYSTFLTKSGILGDTSVHSFVDSGILPQLLVFLLLVAGIMVFFMITSVKERWLFGGISAVLLITGIWGPTSISIILYGVAMLVWVIRSYLKFIPRQKDEEALWSREFWMFIGSLILLVSAVHITWQTSLAVWNHVLEPFSGIFESLYASTEAPIWRKLADHNLAPNKNIQEAYHLVQVPLAFLIMMLVAVTQYFKWKSTKINNVLRKLGRSFIIAFGLTLLYQIFLPFDWNEFPNIALLFASLFAVVANLDYLIAIVKGKWDQAGSSIAHVGFALVILGALLSTGHQEVISRNQIGDIQTLSDELNNREDILLLEKDTLPMGSYFISYQKRYTEGQHLKFAIEYYDRVPKTYDSADVVMHRGMLFQAMQTHEAPAQFTVDHAEEFWTMVPVPNKRQANEAVVWTNGEPGEQLFTLEPRILLNEIMGNSPEPDTKHFLGHDLYTHVKWGRITPPPTDEDGYLNGRAHDVHVGDSILVSSIMVKIDSLSAVPAEEKAKYGLLDKDIAIRVGLTLTQDDRTPTLVEPLYIIRDSLVVPDLVEEEDWKLKFRVNTFDPISETINMTIWEHESIRRDFIVMQAVIFPQINILWIGCVLMAIGTGLAVRNRLRKKKKA